MLPPASFFKTYDIRGVVAQDGFTPANMRYLGVAVAAMAHQFDQKTLVVGRDARLSGASLQAALIEGLLQGGCDVIDLGIVSTPALYFATYHLQTLAGVMVTASHNPPEYNGLKVVLAGRNLNSAELKQLGEFRDFALSHAPGSYSQCTIDEDYYQRICSDITLRRPLKVVVDCANAATSQLAPALLTRLGCHVEPMFCEFDGRFPNHMADPSRPENLQHLREQVLASQADIGIAFDGDGDRLGVVDNQGHIIWPDRIMMAYVKEILARKPKAQFILDVKCSRHVANYIERQGGRALFWKSGHSLMKEKLRDANAVLGGELSGHLFFKDRWFGFDDGVYAAARLLEVLAASDVSASEFFRQLPETYSTPEILVPMSEESARAAIAALREQIDAFGGEALLIDGIRVDYSDGWGLVRSSNTMPCLTLRFEADTPDALAQVQAKFRTRLLAVQPSLSLPF